jgi:outer membrane protein assembly factor BamE (lipoprotein component of BamABCDE complex)
MGEGMAHTTSKETRAAIREGRVIPGMTKDEVLMAVGEPNSKISDSEGNDMWLYARSNGVILDVKFNEQGSVASAKARQGAKNAKGKHSRRGGGIAGGKMKTGTPINE